jgi:hypothetical protein
MNIIIKINGQDVTDDCLLSATRIAYDSTKRITTASISIMGQALGRGGAVYDTAQYDQDVYAPDIRDLYEVQIFDGRDGTTKLFEGLIYAMTLQQSDTPGFSVFYQCDMNDWGAFLDRSVCWDSSFPLTLPNSDQGIILALLTQFCPKISVATANIAQIVPTIQSFDWVTKTCRQVLDDLSTLSMGSWRVDFDGVLYYYLASSAPAAPFNLSTSPDYSTTFPLKVDGYKQDFTNPVNTAYVRGTSDATGVTVQASYSDPVSVQDYGVYATGLVDDSIITGYDAALRAKSIVLQYAYPIETGAFTIWGPDGLECGMQVHILEENVGINGDYTIIALTMQWQDASLVRYEVQFGAARPDLETILRLLDQRTKWKTSNVPVSQVSPGPPPPGSVTDASIAAPGLSASSIQSVSAGTIQGQINAGQIGTVSATAIIGSIQANQIAAVNAGAIVGVIASNQIGSVSASVIQGSIQAGQIGTVNAGSIQGVVVSSQLADQIVNNLAKYADALRPVQIIKVGDPWPPAMPNSNFPPNSFFYYQPDGNFYQVNAAGTGWTVNNNPQGSMMSFFNIGMMRANSIVGLILAAQINSITAGQITGQVQANQIGAVNASAISGQIAASQISTVNAGSIQGTIAATQIATITAGQITGTISAGQIATVTAGQITGSIAYTQIGSVNAATITIGQLNDSQISGMSGAKLTIGTVDSTKFNGFSIDIGGGTNLPARMRVLQSGTVVAQLGLLSEVGIAAYGGWFQLFGAGGTAYSNAPIYTDAGGNLFIRSANMSGSTLSGASMSNPSINVSGQIYTSPSTFDATYSTLAWINEQSPDKTSFISRGLVFYYNNSKIGSIVRSPGGGYLELECAVGGAYVLINGSNGVRSDLGYSVGSTRVINSSGQFTGGVSTGSSISTSSSITASSGYFGGTFQGSSVSVSGSCTASSGYFGGTFQGSGVSVSGSCQASGGYTGGAFTGAGVQCPSNGIGGLGFNPTGWSGQTYNIAWRDNAGNPLELWINGSNQGQVQLRVVGGVVVGLA